ncbi:MAG: M48 family metalloprotease [Magnetovibrio sp.]|nr:M48 family metalloprotease [Magnetovibrio sp.]
MKYPWKTLSLLCLGLVLTACQTTSSKETYRSAFERGATPGKQVENLDKKIPSYAIADLRPGERPELKSDEAGLWMMMDRAETGLATSGNRVNDPQLNDYVQKIVCKIAREYCKDFRVYIMRVPNFNASMAPNGTMLLHTGFLLRTKNEAQLSALIGHEIAHYLRRHSSQRLKDTIAKTNALAFIQLASMAAGVGAVGDMAMLATIGSMKSFSRDNEREADGYGLALMVRAGYDPIEAANIWARVIRERDAIPDNPQRNAFLSTHPPSDERNKALNDLSSTVENANELRTGETTYQAAIAALRGGFMRDELAKRQHSSTLALFDMLLEDGHLPGEIHFYRGELYRLRNDEGDVDKALSAYRKALAEGNVPAELYKSHGLTLKRAGKKDAARMAFSTYLELAPHAADRKMIQFMIERKL